VPKAAIIVLSALAMLGLTPLAAHSSARTAPTRSISVSGVGVAMYPAFRSSIHRYGLTTSARTRGAVTVTASTSDHSGSVWVDGKPVASGKRTLSGLTTGDEISVFIKDSSGTTAYSLIYLPVGFPTMTVVTKTAGIAPGKVFLTPTDFTGNDPSFETAVDNNGVPIYVRTDGGVPLDFKVQANGDYSVARDPAINGQTAGSDQIDELNSKFEKIGAYSTVGGLTDTDGHDSLLEPNGDRWLIASEPTDDVQPGNTSDGLFDAYIQEQSPTGTVLFQWDSADYGLQAESMLPNSPDYAHLNSIWLMKNGDILASFRHLSQVMEIATSAHNGFEPGDIVWSLGGQDPTLTTLDDPDGGPCAQHSASQLPNGDILMFDDGSQDIDNSAPLCPNYLDPPNIATAVQRPQTRVVEYTINQTAKTATMVWSYDIPGRDSNFEGSAQRLSNGDTMIGWGPNTAAYATEVNMAGKVVWELKGNNGLFSYRSQRFPAPDKIPPSVDVTRPGEGATYTYGQVVHSDFSCTDRGGSTLQSCAGPVTEGAAINTSALGTHTFTVTAKDGAGNTTKVKRTYTIVGSKYQPDAMIKKLPGGSYVGSNVLGGINHQQVKESIRAAGQSVDARVRLVNRGSKADRLVLSGTAGTSKFAIRYFVGATNVTKTVTAGTYKTPRLAPGRSLTLRLEVTRTTHAKVGDTRIVKLTATSHADAVRHDTVAAVVRAIHRAQRP
jgi:hypothetical protein